MFVADCFFACGQLFFSFSPSFFPFSFFIWLFPVFLSVRVLARRCRRRCRRHHRRSPPSTSTSFTYRTGRDGLNSVDRYDQDFSSATFTARTAVQRVRFPDSSIPRFPSTRHRTFVLLFQLLDHLHSLLDTDIDIDIDIDIVDIQYYYLLYLATDWSNLFYGWIIFQTFF